MISKIDGYKIKIESEEKSEGTEWKVTFVDFPKCYGTGDSLELALVDARLSLATMMYYLKEDKPKAIKFAHSPAQEILRQGHQIFMATPIDGDMAEAFDEFLLWIEDTYDVHVSEDDDYADSDSQDDGWDFK